MNRVFICRGLCHNHCCHFERIDCATESERILLAHRRVDENRLVVGIEVEQIGFTAVGKILGVAFNQIIDFAGAGCQ